MKIDIGYYGESILYHNGAKFLRNEFLRVTIRIICKEFIVCMCVGEFLIDMHDKINLLLGMRGKAFFVIMGQHI